MKRDGRPLGAFLCGGFLFILACNQLVKQREEGFAGVGEACIVDFDCSQNSTCVANVCHNICHTPNDCLQGDGCHDGICGKCYSDSECKNGYVCHMVLGVCGARCDYEEDCNEKHYCAADGVCLSKKPLGGHCESDKECINKQCVDGVCCENRCQETCMSCNIPGSLGSCLFTPMGQEDDENCRDIAVCSGNNLALGHLACDGHGWCSQFVADTTCDPYFCQKVISDGGSEIAACATTCQNNEDCHSGTFCSAGHCQNKLALGADCHSDTICASGYCSDGVCCDSPCDADCKSCNSLGHCTPTAAGLPDGACDGKQVACQNEDGRYYTNLCDGQGFCNYYASQLCSGGYLCDKQIGNCLSSCKDSGKCQKGYYCDLAEESPTWGQCVARRQQGERCDDVAIKCVEGLLCVDGFCCNSSCEGLCEACNVPGKEGQCNPVVNALDDSCQGHQCLFEEANNLFSHYVLGCNEKSLCAGLFLRESCDAYGCNSSNMCQSFCTVYCRDDLIVEDGCNGHDPSLYCRATSQDEVASCGSLLYRPTLSGTCTQKELNGVTCTGDRECQSGNCVDGFCCNAAACHTSCQGNILTERSCDTGSCEVNNLAPCKNFLRCRDENTCLEKCQKDDDCLTDYYCDESNSCQPKKPGGAICSADNECSDNHCVAENCCNAALCPNSCNNGELSLNDCSAGFCSTSIVLPCNGHLLCKDATSCKEKCQADSDCVSGYYCAANNLCQAKIANGLSCEVSNSGSFDDPCQSGICSADGVCCDKTCAGACEACNLAGSLGTCTTVPNGSEGPRCHSECGETIGFVHSLNSEIILTKSFSLLTKRKCISAVCQEEVLERSPYACLPDNSGYYSSCAAYGTRYLITINSPEPEYMGELYLRNKATQNQCHASFYCQDGTYTTMTHLPYDAWYYEAYLDGVCK